MTSLGYTPSEIAKVVNSQQQLNKTVPEEALEGLRDYQQEDVTFLYNRKNGGCFNEQRTGKTPTSIRAITAKVGRGRVLVIAPASTLYQWKAEWERWASSPVRVVDGTKVKRAEIIKGWTEGALIIGYECLRERTVYNENTGEIVTTGDIKLINQIPDIQACILDEAHRIKNHKSNQAQALFSLSWIPHKLALTGTPAPGKPHEIYSILHWLFPTIFSGYWRFIDYYFRQDKRWGTHGEYTDIGSFSSKEKEYELQEFLNVVSTRRLRSTVMKWLPNKDYVNIKLPVSKQQEDYLKQLTEDFEIEGTDINEAIILTMLLRCRQICLHPKTLELKGKSPKAEWIKQYLKDYPEKQVLIFSHFTEWLKILSEELKEPNLIIGPVSKIERERLKNEFQAGRIRVLLINTVAGNVGLTLDNADTCIFTDSYPPVGLMQQAEDRFVATTKDMLHRDHTVIKLVMEGTYEESIQQLLDKNASEVDVINNFKTYLEERRR